MIETVGDNRWIDRNDLVTAGSRAKRTKSNHLLSLVVAIPWFKTDQEIASGCPLLGRGWHVQRGDHQVGIGKRHDVEEVGSLGCVVRLAAVLEYLLKSIGLHQQMEMTFQIGRQQERVALGIAGFFVQAIVVNEFGQYLVVAVPGQVVLGGNDAVGPAVRRARPVPRLVTFN